MRPSIEGFIFCFLIMYIDEASQNENNVRYITQRTKTTIGRDSGHPESLAELKELKAREIKG